MTAGPPRAGRLRAGRLAAGWVAAGWLLAVLALPGAGRAEQVATGATLTVSDPCAAAVELREDPSLAGRGAGGAASGGEADGRVGVAAEPEGAGPTVSGGESVRVGGPCRKRAERLWLRVSPGLAVRLAGGAAWRVEAMGGTVEATLEGRGDAEFGAMRVLRLRRSGSGDAHVEAVAERFEAAQSGTGDVTVGRLSGTAALSVGDTATITVDHAALDGLEVAGIDDGKVTLREGRIGRLSAAMSGDSALLADIVAATASLVARDDARVEVARVDGTLDRIAGNDATVFVRAAPGEGAPTQAAASPDASHDLRVRTGDGGEAAAVGGRRGTAHSHVLGWLPPALVGFAVWSSLAVARRTRRARRRRPESLRAGWSQSRRGQRETVPEPRQAQVAWSGEARVAALGQRLAGVEARLVRVERYVTSGELELQRQFRDLAR